MSILEEIIAKKVLEVKEHRLKIPVRELEKGTMFRKEVLPMTTSILDENKTGIIAEFKRKSPSRGVINSYATVEEVTTGYFRAGASALSVLTDMPYFGGSAHDFLRARELNPIPILRKDFIVDEYQVWESKAMGADAILLITAALDHGKIRPLAALARSMGLQVLLEVHDEIELDAINEHVDMVGVNNRDLNTFSVDVERSFKLAEKIPEPFIRISESGIASPLVIKKLRSAGFHGFLIGESFMRTADPGSAFSDFVKLIL
jgi:indole-3-glycerol phosphate synthase